MPRTIKPPQYRLHNKSGKAITTLRDRTGRRRDVLLGPYGSPESRAKYAAVIAEWELAGRALPATDTDSAGKLTVAELVLQFWAHAERHYRHKDGTPTKELAAYRQSLRPLVHLYGGELVKDFGPLKLRAVRQLMIDGYVHPRYGPQAKLARRLINQRIGRVRRVFKWGVSHELVPPHVFQGLLAVTGLQAGRCDAHETERIKPVQLEVVERTLPFLPPVVADMVRLQLLLGCRPGEIVQMRRCDIDVSGGVWEYRPQHHKNAWRGHQRVIAIGPRAQEIIRRYLDIEPTAYLFSPAKAQDAWHAERRRQRRTPMTPSQARRKRKKRPKRKPRDHYDVESYGRAVHRACALAFPAPEPLARRPKETLAQWRARLTPEQKRELKKWNADHRWRLHQLRHTRATEIRRLYGLDAARVVLGHNSPIVTEIYAEKDYTKAREIMLQHG